MWVPRSGRGCNQHGVTYKQRIEVCAPGTWVSAADSTATGTAAQCSEFSAAAAGDSCGPGRDTANKKCIDRLKIRVPTLCIISPLKYHERWARTRKRGTECFHASGALGLCRQRSNSTALYFDQNLSLKLSASGLTLQRGLLSCHCHRSGYWPSGAHGARCTRICTGRVWMNYLVRLVKVNKQL